MFKPSKMNFLTVKNLNCRKIGPNSMPTLKIPTPNLFSGYALLHGTESTTDSLCPTINIIIILININKPGSKLQKYPKESWLTQSPLK